MYMFPRECPRILVWPLETTTAHDLERWFGDSAFRMVAHIERDWLERVQQGSVYRYELPVGPFECLDDAGMWVSREPVTPLGMEVLDDLPGALSQQQVRLVVMDTLAPLKDVWSTTLHASGIRLRNAHGWIQ
jgi:hypothetical protein